MGMNVFNSVVSYMSNNIRYFCLLVAHICSETKHIVGIERRAYRVLMAAILVLLTLLFLLFACNITNSLALTAFSHLIIVDLLSLVVAFISLWSKRQIASLNDYNFGYERFEVVAVFATTILAILSSFFEIKEGVELIFEPAEVHPRMLLVSLPVAFFVHLMVTYGVENPAFSHVILASGSSLLQEHATDISRTLCRFVPGLSRHLLPRINPLSLVGVTSSCVVAGVYFLLTAADQLEKGQLPNTQADSIGGIIISLMLLSTMLPIVLYSGRILLQTVPAHLVRVLDKALYEASTIDGVLELQNEHVWSVGFGTLAGSLCVRVRRDADEQLVLAHVTNRLKSLVKYLTIQVRKDDWTRTSRTLAMNWPMPPHPSMLGSRTVTLKEHLANNVGPPNGSQPNNMQAVTLPIPLHSHAHGGDIHHD